MCVTWLGFLCIATIMFIKYRSEDFLTFGLVWLPVWTHWLYCAPKTLYWFPLYFHLICYYLKCRLISIEDELKDIIKSQIHWTRKEILINVLLRRHQRIMKQIKCYNDFWNQYLTQCMIIFGPIILFLSYLYFFTFMIILMKIEFTLALIANTFLLTFVLISSSEVSNRTQTTYKLLNSLFVAKLSIKTKLKVLISLQMIYSKH